MIKSWGTHRYCIIVQGLLKEQDLFVRLVKSGSVRILELSMVQAKKMVWVMGKTSESYKWYQIGPKRDWITPKLYHIKLFPESFRINLVSFRTFRRPLFLDNRFLRERGMVSKPKVAIAKFIGKMKKSLVLWKVGWTPCLFSFRRSVKPVSWLGLFYRFLQL